MPLPAEKEEAYWAAIRYFAEVMFADAISELYNETDNLSELGEP